MDNDVAMKLSKDVNSFLCYSSISTSNDLIKQTLDSDLVSANNEKNEKLNEMSQVDRVKNLGEDSDDEIDDDWFLKLTNSKDGPHIPPVDGASELGTNCTNTLLLCDEDIDFKEKTMKTLRVGLKKIWRRGSVTITVEDPTYKVTYLGNVLTGWAKGEGCIEKPLNSLWKNYKSSSKPDVQMKITVTQSGLKAITKDHGLIEYWSNRITYCTVPPGLPRIFCWIYRHEGRKLKQELRCHAILCSKESMAARMATTLKLRLTQALLEFKRDKVLRQNARLSLANSVYDNPSLPRRKILLSTGCHNYKPPLERSKSAPKLMSIEESLEEEENTPKAKRKLSGEAEAKVRAKESGVVRDLDDRSKRKNVEETKCDCKITNLNFVKKLCSSIENLVESTSNYSKKFFTERRSSREFYLSTKKMEDPTSRNIEEDTEEAAKRAKARRSVSFEMIRENFLSPVQCTDFKKLEEEEPKPVMEITLEVRDQESDEGSNSLQSLSSCCSDLSSLVTTCSDKSSEVSSQPTDGDLILTSCGDHLLGSQTPIERLQTYLSSCNDVFLDEVVLHPTGQADGRVNDEALETEVNGRKISYEENAYVDLAENLVKRLNLDRKEKDVPYHKIFKSTALSQRRLQSSCLQI